VLDPQILYFNVLGLLSSVAIPVVCHFVIYGKTISFRSVINSVLIAEYVFITAAIVLGTAGFFYWWLLLPLLLGCFYGARVLSWRFHAGEDRNTGKITQVHVFFILAFVVFALLLSQIRPVRFSSDSYGKYMGLGRIIAVTHTLPVVDPETLENSHSSRAPVTALHSALLFALLKAHGQIARGTPLYFFILTVLLLMGWGYEAKGLVGSFVFPIVALGSLYFLHMIISVTQEPPVLFFSTLSFYYLRHYLSERSILSLFYLVAAVSLGLLSKESMLAVACITLIGLVASCRSRQEFVRLVFCGLLFSFPVIMWFARNYYYWGNPVFPFFENFFTSWFYDYTLLGRTISAPIIRGADLTSLQFVKAFMLTFPLILFAVSHVVRHWEEDYVKVVFVALLVTFIFLVSGGLRWLVRYLVLFLGVYAAFAGMEVIRIKERFFPRVRWQFILGVAGILIVTGFSVHASRLPSYKQTKGYRFKVMEYFERETPNKKVLRFFGNETLDLATWYSRTGKVYMVYRLHDLRFIKLIGGKLDFMRGTNYLHKEFKKAGIEYVYFVKRKDPYEQIFRNIEGDQSRFKLIYENGQAKVWKLR